MVRRGLLLLLALAAPGAAAAKKAGLFDRILAATGAGHRKALDELGDVLLNAGDVPEELLAPLAFAPQEDAWATDPELGILSKLMEGDYMSVFTDIAYNKEFTQLWDEPRAVAFVLKNHKILEGIRGVPEIAAKKDEDITAEDGAFVREQIQKLVKAYVEKSKVMSTTEGLQGLITHYQSKFADMYIALKPDAPGTAQDKAAAARRLQQAIADDAWGGLIDLDKFGLNGEVPAAITEARDRLIQETPQTWELVTQGDPFIKQVLQNPFKAAEIAQQTFALADEGFSAPIGP